MGNESPSFPDDCRRRLAGILGSEDAQWFPVETEKSFPRILQRIVEMWDSPELQRYFEDLLTTTRTDRQGFPDTVAQELFRLSGLHDSVRRRSGRGGNAWESSIDPDLLHRR